MKQHICKCKKPMTKKEFAKGRTLFYCMECYEYTEVKDDCEHDMQPVVYILADGRDAIKKTCTKCYFKADKFDKKSDHDITKLPRRDNEESGKMVSESMAEMRELKCMLYMSRHQDLQVDRKADYKEYMRSPEWKAKRLLIMQRDGYTCQICRGKALDVHHLTYKNFKKEYLFELVALCRPCHENVYHKK